MKYRLIDREEAPTQDTKTAPTERRRQIEQIVAALVPGKAAQIDLGPKDTARGVKASLTRAAKRQERPVRSWDINGVVYAELVENEDTR